MPGDKLRAFLITSACAMATDLIAGFLSCAVLIVAIGAQNSFILRQGIRRERVLTD